MKPNFASMTRKELKAYVLQHRDDQEAFQILMSRRSPDSEATWYKFANEEEDSKEIMQRKIKSEIKQN
jgi:hypothetical protein